MNPNITVAEVMQEHKTFGFVLDKEIELRDNIQKLLVDFKEETGFYAESIHVSYYDSFSNKRSVTAVEIYSRINT